MRGFSRLDFCAAIAEDLLGVFRGPEPLVVAIFRQEVDNVAEFMKQGYDLSAKRSA